MIQIRFGTRASRLAQRQTEWVIEHLRWAHPEVSISVVQISTRGDRDVSSPLRAWENQGVFVSELETALLAGEIDVAVHSLKDIPTDHTPGLTIAAIPERAEPRDVLVSRSGARLAHLPAGSRVGTSSLRRQAQLLAARPDVAVCDLRGNVDTRIAKVQGGDIDAAILAAAGIQRIDQQAVITEYLPVDVVTPAPGQGALAVQTRSGDPVINLLQTLDHAATRCAVLAERSLLAALGGGCHVPVGAYASVEGDCLALLGLVASPDGRTVLRLRATGPVGEPTRLGQDLASNLISAGAADLLRQFPPPARGSDIGP